MGKGKGRVDRRRVWGATEPTLKTGAGRQTGKMVNRYAAIVYIRLNARMIKQKKKYQRTPGVELDGHEPWSLNEIQRQTP